MTRRCGLHLRERNVPIVVINRTLDTATELATELGAKAVSLTDFRRDPAALDCARWCLPAAPPSRCWIGRCWSSSPPPARC